MNRRDFLRTVAVVPVIPFAALAGPTPAGAQDIRTKRFLFRVSELMPQRQTMPLRAYLRKWEEEGQRSLILPDTVEMFRLEE